MPRYILILILSQLLWQSCAVHQKEAITLNDALKKKNILIDFKNGEKMKFKRITKKDSTYYGENNAHHETGYAVDSSKVSRIFYERSNIARNVIHGMVSGYILSGSGISISYDRNISQFVWISTSVGSYPVLINNGKKVDCKLTFLTGKRNSHFELALGITYAYAKAGEPRYTQAYGMIPGSPEYNQIRPAFSIGYRFQKPNGGFIFHTGFGFLEAKVGIGYSF